jgi:hypothetical protein
MMLAFLRNLLPHIRRQRPDLRFVLITRKECHLCDDALALLEMTRNSHGIGLEIVDVDSSGDLAAQYGQWVPVVLVNEKVRFRGRINPVLLHRILEATE